LTRFKDDEWSGPAWFKLKTDSDGYPEEWKIVHFHPLNLGDHTSTEFEAKDVAGILEDTYNNNKNLLKNTFMGLIHSHNTMGSFFSGTDTDTLLEMAPIENFYGSLIVASSGKELASFGFSYKDQYGVSHSHVIEEDEIELEDTYKINNEWIAVADKIEKDKPKPKPGNQVGIWKPLPRVNTLTEAKEALSNLDKKNAILDKLSKKKKKIAEDILLKNDSAEMTDIAAEDALQKLGIDLMDVLKLMDDDYNYGYGGYNGYLAY